MSNWTPNYDPQARVAYITLIDIMMSDAVVVVTRRITSTVLIDMDADANLVGIEILDVAKAPTP